MEEGKLRGEGEVVGGGLGGKGTAMGMLGFSVAEAGIKETERTVDVSPGTRRPISFWMECGFWEDESQKVRARGED